MTDEVFDALEDLCEKERLALLDGDLDALPRFAERKSVLIGRLEQSGDPIRFADLGKSLARNGSLLAAAADGLRSGIQRLRALAAPPPPLTTYDGSGQRRDLDRPEGELIRRA